MHVLAIPCNCPSLGHSEMVHREQILAELPCLVLLHNGTHQIQRLRVISGYTVFTHGGSSTLQLQTQPVARPRCHLVNEHDKLQGWNFWVGRPCLGLFFPRLRARFAI